VNGQFVPDDEARVSIHDRGFLHGEGVFETMRVYAGRVAWWTPHRQRLEAGLAALGIAPASLDLQAACVELVQRNAVHDGVARIYVTPDSTVVTARARQFAPRRLTAMVSDVRVDVQVSRYKTANRLPYLMAAQQARQAGVDEAALLNTAGNIVELTTSNLFVAKDGRLYTPPLADGPLPGITRAVVMRLLPVEERSVTPAFLAEADEVFATNSLLEIAPVSNWSRASVMTDRAQQVYRAAVHTNRTSLIGC
jgi:branched-subunit amino acid aminotransferase/4-amino-4-deoxychorismate lyase